MLTFNLSYKDPRKGMYKVKKSQPKRAGTWMAWRDSSWRASLFGWLGESTGQALGNFQTPSWLVVTWTKPAEETSSQNSLYILPFFYVPPLFFFIRRPFQTTDRRTPLIQEISSQNKPNTAPSFSNFFFSLKKKYFAYCAYDRLN